MNRTMKRVSGRMVVMLALLGGVIAAGVVTRPGLAQNGDPGCSFDNAIQIAQSAPLSATGRYHILVDLYNAQARTGVAQCYWLACALCLAQTEAAAGRLGGAELVPVIQCLQATFCGP